MLFLFRSSVVLVLCYCCVGVVPMMLLDVIVVPRLFLRCSIDVVVLFLCCSDVPLVLFLCVSYVIIVLFLCVS